MERQYDKRTEVNFSLEKRNFLGNTLCYFNQGCNSTINGVGRGRGRISYLQSRILLYDQVINKFLGLQKELAYIVLRGDDMECFFSYGFNEKNSNVLYSAAKDRIPNAVITTSFKKHFDRKEKINQHKENVNLNPIDCSLDYLN